MSAWLERLIDHCPMGHRIRAVAGIRDRSQSRTNYEEGFEFETPRDLNRESPSRLSSETDPASATMDTPTTSPSPTTNGRPSVSDTGVMRIIDQWTAPKTTSDVRVSEAHLQIERAKQAEAERAADVELSVQGDTLRPTVISLQSGCTLTKPVECLGGPRDPQLKSSFQPALKPDHHAT